MEVQCGSKRRQIASEDIMYLCQIRQQIAKDHAAIGQHGDRDFEPGCRLAHPFTFCSRVAP